MVPVVWQLMGDDAGHDFATAAARPSRVLKARRENDIARKIMCYCIFPKAKEIKPSL